MSRRLPPASSRDGLWNFPSSKALRADDVGVQGGESKRWHALGDHVLLHGFDAIEEVARSSRRRIWRTGTNIITGSQPANSGEHTLYFDAENPFSSSFYQQGETKAQPREVQVRRLDTLMAGGVIPPADFLKVDVEGYEKDVFLGAGELLKGLLGFETETAFTVSDEYPSTHFGTVLDIALKNHQRVFDIEFNRVPRASFQRALERENRPPIDDQITVGRPATVNVLPELDRGDRQPGELPKRSAAARHRLTWAQARVGSCFRDLIAVFTASFSARCFS